MKRFYFVIAIVMATVCGLMAAQVGEADARNVADKFFQSHCSRLMAPSSQPGTRLAYRARDNRFYIFDRGGDGGFVMVAGDDRLPQVLGYGDKGDFSAPDLPPAGNTGWMRWSGRLPICRHMVMPSPIGPWGEPMPSVPC